MSSCRPPVSLATRSPRSASRALVSLFCSWHGTSLPSARVRRRRLIDVNRVCFLWSERCGSTRGEHCWSTRGGVHSVPAGNAVPGSPAGPAGHPGPARKPGPQPPRCDNAPVITVSMPLRGGSRRAAATARAPHPGTPETPGTSGTASPRARSPQGRTHSRRNAPMWHRSGSGPAAGPRPGEKRAAGSPRSHPHSNKAAPRPRGCPGLTGGPGCAGPAAPQRSTAPDRLLADGAALARWPGPAAVGLPAPRSRKAAHGRARACGPLPRRNWSGTRDVMTATARCPEIAFASDACSRDLPVAETGPRRPGVPDAPSLGADGEAVGAQPLHGPADDERDQAHARPGSPFRPGTAQAFPAALALSRGMGSWHWGISFSGASSPKYVS